MARKWSEKKRLCPQSLRTFSRPIEQKAIEKKEKKLSFPFCHTKSLLHPPSITFLKMFFFVEHFWFVKSIPAVPPLNIP